MYGKGNCVQHPVINHNRKEIGKEYTHIYIYMYNWILCCLPDTNTMLWSTILQLKKKNTGSVSVYPPGFKSLVFCHL